MEEGYAGQPLLAVMSYLGQTVSWWDFTFSFWLCKLELRNETVKLFVNLSRFEGLTTIFHISNQLTLSFLLPEASYLFLAPVYIQSGNGKCAVLPFLDLK